MGRVVREFGRSFPLTGGLTASIVALFFVLAAGLTPFLRLGAEDTGEDFDGDGLSDYEEDFYYGTDPYEPDSDWDGYDDYFEVMDLGSDPWDPYDPYDPFDDGSGGDESMDGSDWYDDDGDGYSEFTSSDGRFLYAFGSYASSWPPGVVLSFRNGMLVDVTRQFPKRLRSQMQAAYQQAENIYAQEDALGINSILAGYVAQKILLGEYQSGWDYMLAHYDPTDTWGLTTTTPSGEVVQKYPDYPSALTDFLIDLEYLTVNGTPNPNLDLSRTIVEQESLL